MYAYVNVIFFVYLYISLFCVYFFVYLSFDVCFVYVQRLVEGKINFPFRALNFL